MDELIVEAASDAREVRAVLSAAPSLPVTRASLLHLDSPANRRRLASGRCLPVGSLNFVLAAMRLAGLQPPAPLGFPAPVQALLHRQLVRGVRADARGLCFMKPVTPGLFPGFVCDHALARPLQPPALQRELERLGRWPLDLPVWLSEVVRWRSEWRYYVVGGCVVGCGPYAGAPEAAPPESAKVQAAVAALPWAQPYALDMGVLEDGRTALVSLSDAYALGLVDGALVPGDYLQLLWARWQSLQQPMAAPRRWPPQRLQALQADQREVLVLLRQLGRASEAHLHLLLSSWSGARLKQALGLATLTHPLGRAVDAEGQRWYAWRPPQDTPASMVARALHARSPLEQSWASQPQACGPF